MQWSLPQTFMGPQQQLARSIPIDQRTAYDAGQIVVRSSQAPGSNLCETYHPPAYFRRVTEALFDEAAFDGGFEDGGFVALEVGLDALEVGDGFVEAGELLFDFRDDAFLVSERRNPNRCLTKSL